MIARKLKLHVKVTSISNNVEKYEEYVVLATSTASAVIQVLISHKIKNIVSIEVGYVEGSDS